MDALEHWRGVLPKSQHALLTAAFVQGLGEALGKSESQRWYSSLGKALGGAVIKGTGTVLAFTMFVAIISWWCANNSCGNWAASALTRMPMGGIQRQQPPTSHP